MAVFYVSTLGNDSATGLSITDAFKTVEKAVAAMHASAGADIIMISSGTYEIKSTLVLTASDNGSAIQAYGNEKPVLLGGQAVTEWTAGPNGIWTAPLAQADLHQLTLNAERMTEARFPNTVPNDPVKGGWLWAEAAPAGIDPLKQMAFDTADISASQLQVGMKVHLFTDASWAEVDLTVQSVDWSKGVITFAEAAPYDIGAASRFYVHDGNVHLDQPGEWWFDTAKQVINVKAPPNFDGTGVVASGDYSIIHIDNAANISISGLAFSDVGTGAATADVETAAIKITAGSFINIAGNSFANVVKGVESVYLSDHITVTNNDYSHLWSSAIQLGHQSSQNTVTGNSIVRAGEVFATFAAIDMAENWGNLISENLIRDVPRIGIGEVNYDSTLKSGANTIENNIIVHSNQSTSDSGAIYIYSKPDNTHLGDIIRNNIVVDTGGVETGNGAFLPGQHYTNGIYLDDNTSRAQVYNNFVQGSVVGGAYIHGGSDNSIFNNILLDNKNVGVQLFDIGKPMVGNDVRGNIIDVPFGTGFVTQNNNGNPAAPASLHDNFILNSAGRPIAFELAYTPKTLAQWQALGFDVGTDVINSSIFVNPSTGDYSLKAGVLPLQQGFSPLPMASMQAFRDGIFKWGTTGEDSLTGSSGSDLLEGLSENDTVEGKGGADTLDGGSNGVAGDTLVYASSFVGVAIDLALHTASGGDAQGDIFLNFENVTGSMFGDQLSGDDGANVLRGGAGNDLFVGGLGADTMIGGADLDVVDYSGFGGGVAVNLTTGTGPGGDTISEIENIIGSAFGDVLDGNNGANTMRGGAGNDFMVAGNGADLLIGGADNDEVSYATATTGVFVNLTTGTGANGGVLQEIENIRGSNFGDVLQGDNGANTIRGLDGNDFIIAGNGADLLIGGNDNDTVSYETATSGVFANLTTGTGANGGVLQEIENLTGSNFGDVLIGSALGNTLKGGGGNDFIVGNSGSDALEGGADNDTFRFETTTFGNDVIVDFQDNGDKLSFASAVATNFSQFTILNNNTTNVTVQIAGQSIVVQGAANIFLNAADFVFV